MRTKGMKIPNDNENIRTNLTEKVNNEKNKIKNKAKYEQ